MSPKDKSTKKPKRLPEATIFQLAEDREAAARRAAEANAEKKQADQQIIEQLKIRKVKSLESGEFGAFTRITLVEPETLEYDAEGIRKALKGKRALVFDRNINLNALPAKTLKKILEMVPKDELAAVTTESLNIDRLARAVKEGKVDAEVVKDNSWIKEIAPSIRISHGSGS